MSDENLLESLRRKVDADDSSEITLAELLAHLGTVPYSPIAQATVNHLERMQCMKSRPMSDEKIGDEVSRSKTTTQRTRTMSEQIPNEVVRPASAPKRCMPSIELQRIANR